LWMVVRAVDMGERDDECGLDCFNISASRKGNHWRSSRRIGGRGYREGTFFTGMRSTAN
jgi:hypothetical protein